MNAKLCLSLLGAFALSACATSGQATKSEPTASSNDQMEAGFPSKAPEGAKPRPFALQSPTRQTLGNGLQIVSAPHGGLPLVALQLVVRGGSAADSAEHAGLAELTARLLSEGAGERSGDQIAETIESVGGSIGADASADYTMLSCSSLSEFSDTCVDLMFDLATKPTFPDEAVQRIRLKMIDELRLSEAEPGFLARRAMYGALYGDHPYARVAPTMDSLGKLDGAAVKKMHAAHFVPENAVLVAVGDLAGSKVVEKLAARFEAWAKGDAPQVPRAELPQHGGYDHIHLIDRPDSVQTTLMVGNLTLPRPHSDFLDLRVTNHVLGGGASSRLFLVLREEKSYTYGAYSKVPSYLQGAPFIAQTDVRNEVTGDALRDMLVLIDEVGAGKTTADQLEATQSYLAGVFPIDLQRVGAMASTLAAMEVYGLPADYLQTYRDQVRAVNLDRVKSLGAAWLRPAFIVAVGSADAVAKDLARVAEVRVYGEDGLKQTIPKVEAGAGGD